MILKGRWPEGTGEGECFDSETERGREIERS